MPIKDLVKISNEFADQIGIQQKKADANAEAPKKEVTEVTANDWHYKAIMSIWDKGGSFTRKKLGTIICRDPKASRSDIEKELRDTDYSEVTDFTDRLRIEGIIKEEKVYIDYLNKQKGFKQDRIKFNSYEEAVKWAKKNFEKFNSDMIKYESVNENEDTVADESRMARSGIKTAIESANNIQQIFNAKGEEFDVPAWVQSYLALASDYLHSINEYYNGIENK
jgi:hypothetical protein